MSKLREILEREDGALSMMRIFALIAFGTLIILTYMEFIVSKGVSHYGEFATFTAGIIGMSAGKSVMEQKQAKTMNKAGGSNA